MICSLAHLEGDKLAAVQSFEKKLGKTLIAFSCDDVSVSQLKNEEIAQIQEMEKKLGLSLVAVK